MKGRRDGGLGTKPYALGSLSAFAANFFADIAGARELQKVARPRCSSLLGLRATYPLYQRCVGCEDGECRGSQRESCGESRDSTTREKARQGKSGERGFFLKFFFPSLAVESFTLSPSLFGLLFSLREGAKKREREKVDFKKRDGPAQAGRLVLRRRWARRQWRSSREARQALQAQVCGAGGERGENPDREREGGHVSRLPTTLDARPPPRM